MDMDLVFSIKNLIIGINKDQVKNEVLSFYLFISQNK